MKKLRFIIIALAIIGALLAIFYVVTSENALVTHPKGLIAQGELDVIIKHTLLMLVVIVPTFILLFVIVWMHRAKNPKAKYKTEHSHGTLKEIILWIIPTIVIVVMAINTWDVTHKLDPYKPIDGEARPLTIQVVALDWKWLFIYPEQGIASLNFFQFPERTPIRFELTADGSPMNSFWIPELSGQIYAMSGMVTPLHIMADAPGVYAGRAAEINGRGYADMTFVAKSTSQADFDAWVAQVKQSPLQLTGTTYHLLVNPSKNLPITLYAAVENDLFNKIRMKYQHPAK